MGRTVRYSMNSNKRYSTEELLGSVYGRVVITHDLGTEKSSGHYYRMVTGKCSCGTIKNYRLSQLTRGITRSCGCYNREIQDKTLKKHGLTKHPLHVVWSGMIGRCYHKYYPHYDSYGGDGITVCEEWRRDFKCFYDWAMDNGWRKGLHLDKDIKSRAGSKMYSPETCCFVTPFKNMQHRKNTTYLEMNGEVKSLSEWCRDLDKDYATVRNNARFTTVIEALNKTTKRYGYYKNAYSAKSKEISQ